MVDLALILSQRGGHELIELGAAIRLLVVELLPLRLGGPVLADRLDGVGMLSRQSDFEITNLSLQRLDVLAGEILFETVDHANRGIDLLVVSHHRSADLAQPFKDRRLVGRLAESIKRLALFGCD